MAGEDETSGRPTLWARGVQAGHGQAESRQQDTEYGLRSRVGFRQNSHEAQPPHRTRLFNLGCALDPPGPLPSAGLHAEQRICISERGPRPTFLQVT